MAVSGPRKDFTG